jgi:hypothetical protein
MPASMLKGVILVKQSLKVFAMSLHYFCAMTKLISERTAVRIILVLLSLVIVFHILVLTGAVPYKVVWGGRLKTKADMLRFETMSILINVFMIAIVAIYAGYIKLPISGIVIRILLWLLAGIFALNTVGNLASLNTFEQIVFTPLTLVLCLLFVRLAISKPAVPNR